VKFSVVLVNYADSWRLIERCLDSFAPNEPFEAVVVDNDEVPRAPDRLPNGTKLIRNGRNLGFARAVNRGIVASGGEVIVLINPDSTVEDDFIEKLESFFEANPGAAIAGPRILDGDGKLQLSARREISLASGLLGRTSLFTKLFPDSSLVKSQFPATKGESEIEVDWVSGACMAVRRSALEEIGLLDERFFMYFEDADLCRRAREKGRSVHYLPKIKVVHHVGGSTHDSLRSVWRLHKSAFLYHRKHGVHGPLNLFSALVFAGLVARGFGKLALARLRREPQ
jgi:N-acetylglucosaminyl-diphospho-decaprenol L-rhamnosyltransferase